jgi:hypothetical protein
MELVMNNWKTSVFGIATLLVYVLSYIFPQHKEFLYGIIPVLIAGGLLVAKDMNVTGGSVTQPTVVNPPTLIEKL